MINWIKSFFKFIILFFDWELDKDYADWWLDQYYLGNPVDKDKDETRR